MANELEENRKLPTIFDDLWKSYEYLESCDDPTPSANVQNKVKDAIKSGETAISMINQLGLFSSNEQLEEVATSEIRYMLLPGFLAYFTLKNTKEDRYEVIKKAQIYDVDFLKLVKLYGLTSIEIPKIKDGREVEEKDKAKPPSGGMPDFVSMAKQRGNKIDRYRQQKQTEQKLKDLQKAVKSGKAEDETQREYYTTLLKKWLDTALDECESIEQELPILEHMAKMRREAPNGQPQPPQEKPSDKPKKKFQPFILTRDKLQAQVIGAGYPSLPTYSVEQWAEMTYKDQIQAATTGPGGQSLDDMINPDADKQREELEQAEKEAKIENDDQETLVKAREMDDFKDDHRRGWGNRQNRL